MFERVVLNQLYDHLTKHNLLCEGQYGFGNVTLQNMLLSW